MKFSREWLAEFVEIPEPDAHTLAERITAAIAEVEEVEDPAALLDHCCVGKVLSIQKHPQADRLSLVDVQTDHGKKRVVCGGTNVREGMLVAFAHIGARVKWHGGELMTLAPVKIRGEQSEGMICAAEELGLETLFPASPDQGERPIVDLPSSLKPGTALRKMISGDVTFTVSNTAITHRPDLFSHIGLARELVAAGLATWKVKEPDFTLPKKLPKADLPFSVKGDEALVPRYLACAIAFDAKGQTPEWMKKRLEAVGVRAISLPVDITNYVMLETGAPLHAFDAAKIKGKTIRFRDADKDETLVTLDEQKRVLQEGAIVFTDDEGNFDLCGLMGDLRTSTTDATRTIFLHAPVFDPARTRRTIQHTGLRSDASTIFEKGVPAIIAEQGMARAIHLFLELCPGAKMTSKILEWGSNGSPRPITLSLDRIESFLGITLKPAEITAILKSLGCSVKTAGKRLSVTPPLHRHDLTTDADLIEEVGRLHGYDKIPEEAPVAPLRLPARDRRMYRLRDTLQSQQYLEIVPLSLVGPSLLKRAGIDASEAASLQHPLGEETSLLQPSTLPALLEHAQRNLLHVDRELRTFACGHVFGPSLQEHAELGMLVTRREESGLNDDPFLSIKTHLQSALEQLGYNLHIMPIGAPSAFMHPGRAAMLVAGSGDMQSIGAIFEMHPSIRERFDLPHRSAAAIVHLDMLLRITPAHHAIRPIPHFPSVTYDLTITRDQSHTFADVLKKLKDSHPLLTDVRVHDLYAGKPLQAGQYNLTLRCTYASPERTLTEDEVKVAHAKVIALAQA